MRTRPGMTMIELVVVIALMAIIAGVSAPALASLGQPRNVSGLEVVTTLLRHCRATAIQHAHVVNVTIEPTTARYWVDLPDTTAILSLPQQVTLSARSPRVHFRFAPDGQTITDEPLFVHDITAVTPILAETWTGQIRSVSR